MPSGGARANAGRRQGGVAHARRLLLSALQRGLATAARERGLDRATGLQDEEALAIECAQRIAADMVLAGQGRDVLVLWAQVAPKDGDPCNEPPGGLSGALRRLPGATQPTFSAPVQAAIEPGQGRIFDADGTDQSRDVDALRGQYDESAYYKQGPTDSASEGTTDSASAQPFFVPQHVLPGFVPPLHSLPACSMKPSEMGLNKASLLPGGRQGGRARPVELDGVLVELAQSSVASFGSLQSGGLAQRAVSPHAGEVAGPPTPPPAPL